MGRYRSRFVVDDSDDEFPLSERECAALLAGDESVNVGQAVPKHRMKVRMKAQAVKDLHKQAKTLKSSKSVAVVRRRGVARLELSQVTKRGLPRKRERWYRRDRGSRQSRRLEMLDRINGERYDWKWRKRSKMQWNAEQRQLLLEDRKRMGDRAVHARVGDQVLTPLEVMSLLETEVESGSGSGSESEDLPYQQLMGVD